MSRPNSAQCRWFAFGAAAGMALAFGIACDPAAAQPDYPNRNIRMIYGFPPGADGGLRLMADKLSEVLGKSVIVENLTGAGGNIATDRIAKAAPDGYTIGALNSASTVINPNLYAKLPYDPIKDLIPITLIWAYPNVLMVSNEVPAKTVQGLVALARAKPGELTFGHSGLGTTQHLGGEMMQSLAGISIQQVPYRGPPQIATDLMTGRISAAFLPPGASWQLVQEGRFRALAVTSRTRAAFAPELPTMIESGFPEFEMTVWFGLFVPAGTPQSIVSRINKEMARIVKHPDVIKLFATGGAEAVSSTPEEFVAMIKAEGPYWAKVIKDAGIKPLE